jgi:hypothetical protein
MRAPYTALYSFKITSWLLDEDKRKTDLVSCTLWLATTTHQTKVTSTRTSPDGKGSLTKIGSCVKAKILSPLSFDLMKQLPTYMLSLLFVDFGWSFFLQIYHTTLLYYISLIYMYEDHRDPHVVDSIYSRFTHHHLRQLDGYGRTRASLARQSRFAI